MCATCTHVAHMPKMIQIRHVPDALHRRLKVRAAGAGLTLSDFLRRELEAVANRITDEEFRTRLAALPPVDLGGATAADVIREGREERE